MAFMGALGADYQYIVDTKGDIYSLDKKIYYGNIKNIPTTHQYLSTEQKSSVGLSGLGDLGVTASQRRAAERMVASSKAYYIMHARQNRLLRDNMSTIMASLPPGPGEWYVERPWYEGGNDRPGVIVRNRGYDTPQPSSAPPGGQEWIPPHAEFAPVTITVNDGGTQIPYIVNYQTGYTATPYPGGWGTRGKHKTFGQQLVRALPYIAGVAAIIALPFALPALGLVGAGGAAVATTTAGGLSVGEAAVTAALAPELAVGGAAVTGGAVAAGGGFLATIGAALPSAGTLETIASGVSAAGGVYQKVTQAKAAQKQAAQQQAEAQKVQQQMAQAQVTQDIAQEVQRDINSGIPITQDLVDRAAKVGIKLNPTTGKITPMEAGMFAGISPEKLPYLIGGVAFLGILYYLFADRK